MDKMYRVSCGLTLIPDVCEVEVVKEGTKILHIKCPDGEEKFNKEDLPYGKWGSKFFRTEQEAKDECRTILERSMDGFLQMALTCKQKLKDLDEK